MMNELACNEIGLGGNGMGRRHSAEFKTEVVRQILSGEKSQAQTCREHNLDPKMVRDWRRRYEQRGEAAFGPSEVGKSVVATYESKIAELERLVGRLALENEVLKKTLRRTSEASRSGTK